MRNLARTLRERLAGSIQPAPASPEAPGLSDGNPRTSITDTGRYLEICARAATDPDVFARFRREPAYMEILEVTQSQGAEYLGIINRERPDLIQERLALFRDNDRYGAPITFDYPGIGRVSPTTLRYIKVLADLERHFGDLTGRRIIEIGVGFGGQCRLILSNWRVRSYTLVDLGAVLGLARAYLQKFADSDQATFDTLEFQDPDGEFQGQYDLCISNYAYSELSREVQERYLDRVLRSSGSGYMTCNFISSLSGIDSMSAAELFALIPGARWLPEEPLTHPDNRILVWGALTMGEEVNPIPQPGSVDPRTGARPGDPMDSSA